MSPQSFRTIQNSLGLWVHTTPPNGGGIFIYIKLGVIRQRPSLQPGAGAPSMKYCPVCPAAGASPVPWL